MLNQGYAIAESAYGRTGWAVADALRDQQAVRDEFNRRIGVPRTTIAVGESLGGLISVALAQRYPARFAGALSLCGVDGGASSFWNQALDAVYAIDKLLVPSRSALELTHITDAVDLQRRLRRTITAARRSPAGRARLALAATMMDIPGWYDPTRPEPAPSDVSQRAANLIAWLADVLPPLAGPGRRDLEQRAAGNPSSNVGIDHSVQLSRSADDGVVRTLYRSAGLNLAADLRALNAGPRITANPAAVGYLADNITPNGHLPSPVVTLHNTADGLVPAANDEAFGRSVIAAGSGPFLRQLYIRRAGHCAFSAAEQITAFQLLTDRIRTGTWAASTPNPLNRRAQRLGHPLNILVQSDAQHHPTAPAITNYQPAPAPRD